MDASRLKPIVLALFGLGFLLAAAVADASAAVRDARLRIESAARLQKPAEAIRQVTLAVARLERAWSQPLRWHALAREARAQAELEWLLQGASAASEANLARVTHDALRLSPMFAGGWSRLADLERRGADTACDSAAACLKASFQVAPMGYWNAPQVACERLRSAIKSGYVTKADDLPVRLYLASGPQERVARYCLQGLSRTERARALMDLSVL